MSTLRMVCLAALLAAPAAALAQGHGDGHAGMDVDGPAHDMGPGIQVHGILEQFEGRIGGGANAFRWHGQAWIGTDYDKLWLKSEGFALGKGGVEDGRQEVLYSRAIGTWFDLQAGLRTDLDSGTGRSWAALGVQGTLPQFIELEATAYASDAGHFAARLAAAYDLRLTQRLVLQPEIDLNLYSKADPGRHIGPGLANLDAGIRLRYEIDRKFAPYIGVAYSARFGQTARYTRDEGDAATAVQFVFGIRSWF
ncbi:MAG: copper resistance protein B [Acetobacteraceae bacterium]